MVGIAALLEDDTGVSLGETIFGCDLSSKPALGGDTGDAAIVGNADGSVEAESE